MICCSVLYNSETSVGDILNLYSFMSRFVRKCLQLPKDVANSIIHSPAKDNGLRHLSLTVTIPRLQFAWFDCIETYALKKYAWLLVPCVLKLVRSLYWRHLLNIKWQSLTRTSFNDENYIVLDVWY